MHSGTTLRRSNWPEHVSLPGMLDHLFAPESFGVARKRDLLRQGASDRELRAAVRDGLLIRPRHGWYATPLADAGVLTAVRRGSIVTCVSALRLHGVWAPRTQELHVRRTEHMERQPASQGHHICCRTEREARPCPTAVDSVADALVSCLMCRELWEAVAAMDSLLHQQRVTRSDLEPLLRGRGGKAQQALQFMDSRRESGLETRFQLALISLGIAFEPQAWILGYRVDTLIGRRLIVELDGRDFHTAAAAFESDRARDRHLTAAGYQIVRVTYRQLMLDFEAVIEEILRMVRRRDHMRRFQV